ncbi:TPA: hypothetical protein N3Z33_002421 [Klebsiella aerogenes]|nr:hypothetical protein [Klebsiella aerogenes]
MTDITELAQSLKAAADSVIKNYDIEWFEAGHQICTVHKSKINLISLANPANILALVEELEKAQTINAVAEKLVRCKGRYHSEQNYRALAALFGVTTPDLPPLDGESRIVTVKLPQAVSAGGQGYQEKVERILTAAGIKWEAE